MDLTDHRETGCGVSRGCLRLISVYLLYNACNPSRFLASEAAAVPLLFLVQGMIIPIISLNFLLLVHYER